MTKRKLDIYLFYIFLFIYLFLFFYFYFRWVEQDPKEILASTYECINTAVDNLKALNIDPADIKGTLPLLIDTSSTMPLLFQDPVHLYLISPFPSKKYAMQYNSVCGWEMRLRLWFFHTPPHIGKGK